VKPGDIRTWLAARRPAPPPALAAQLEAVLAACPPDRLQAAGSMAAALSLLGVGALDALEGRAPDGRGVAMDLLAADAFVTYAFEAASDQDEPVDAVAAGVLARVRP
jgi:hypothetical protein